MVKHVRSPLGRLAKEVVKKRAHSYRLRGGTRPKLKRVRPPKPIKPPKPDRPKRSDLKRLYRGLLSSIVDHRVAVLYQALQWYDQALAYVKFKQDQTLTTEQQREESAFLRYRLKGRQSDRMPFREEQYLKALGHCERMVAVYKPPSVAKFITKLEENWDALRDRDKRLKHKYGRFLDQLHKALNPKTPEGHSIDLRVARLDKEFRIDSESAVTFDRRMVHSLRQRARNVGLLAAILQVMPAISAAAALIPELDQSQKRTGHMILDNKRRYESVLEMLESLIKWMTTDETAPRKLVRTSKPKVKEVV